MEDFARQLLALTERTMEHAAQDPLSNPVLSVTLAITRQIDSGELNGSSIG